MARLEMKKQTPKGVRLGWTPLSDVSPVKVVLANCKGVKVTPKKRTAIAANNSASRNYLIP